MKQFLSPEALQFIEDGCSIGRIRGTQHGMTSETLGRALEAMKAQANAAMLTFPDQSKETRESGRAYLEKAQSTMDEYPKECSFLIRTAKALNTPVLDLHIDQVMKLARGEYQPLPATAGLFEEPT